MNEPENIDNATVKRMHGYCVNIRDYCNFVKRCEDCVIHDLCEDHFYRILKIKPCDWNKNDIAIIITDALLERNIHD